MWPRQVVPVRNVSALVHDFLQGAILRDKGLSYLDGSLYCMLRDSRCRPPLDSLAGTIVFECVDSVVPTQSDVLCLPRSRQSALGWLAQ